MTGRLSGTARFVPEPGGLRYTESGTLIFGAYQGMATQSYGYVLLTPSMASVQFEDGRPFHHLDLSTGRADIVHACAPDAYRGRYRVGSPERWSLAWIVTGPRKRLRIVTRYRRV
jgi:hypothetical protein